MKYRTAFALGIVALSATSACAASDHLGWYVGVGVGASSYSGDIPKQIHGAYSGNAYYTVTSAKMTDDSDTAAQVFVGYQFLPWLGVEAGYQHLGEGRTHYSTQAIDSPPSRPTLDGRYTARDFNAALVASLPLKENFELLARAGLAEVRLGYSESGADAYRRPYYFRGPNDNALHPQAGIGGLWHFARAFALRLDLDRNFNVGKKFALHADTNGRFDGIDAYTLNLVWSPGAR